MLGWRAPPPPRSLLFSLALYLTTLSPSPAGWPPPPPQAFVLPTTGAVPPYKTWSFTARNVLSLETGKRMFYTGGCGPGLLCVCVCACMRVHDGACGLEGLDCLPSRPVSPPHSHPHPHTQANA